MLTDATPAHIESRRVKGGFETTAKYINKSRNIISSSTQSFVIANFVLIWLLQAYAVVLTQFRPMLKSHFRRTRAHHIDRDRHEQEAVIFTPEVNQVGSVVLAQWCITALGVYKLGD